MLQALVSLLHLLPLALAANPEPFWTIQQGGALLTSRLDSIISPGGVSGHQHAIVGASNFGPDYDYEESLKSDCVSGNLNIDFSNYWAPQLYRKVDGGVKLVGLSYSNTYYFVRRQENEPIHEFPFPPGFRMMAGNATRTTLDTTDRAQDAIRYVCLYQGGPETHEFPKQQCPGGLRAQVFFPNCWDGKNNWLAGNKHVAYPSEGNFDGGGKCPSTHPKRIVSLFYEWVYHDDDPYVPGARVFANGDDVGYSLHGDFVNGWPEGTFTKILSYGSECAVEFSLEKCPVLKPHMQDSGKCKYQGLLVDEDIGLNGVAALPGNNPIWNPGPHPAANYVEKGVFVRAGDNSTKITPKGPGKQYDQINAGNIHIATVKGDTGYTGPTFIAGDGATNGVVATATVTSDNTLPTQGSMSASSSASSSTSTLGPVLIASDVSSSSGMDVPASTSQKSSRPTGGSTCNRRRSRRSE